MPGKGKNKNAGSGQLPIWSGRAPPGWVGWGFKYRTPANQGMAPQQLGICCWCSALAPRIIPTPLNDDFLRRCPKSFNARQAGLKYPYVGRRCKCALLESINMYYDLEIIQFERGLKRKVAWFSPTFCLFQFAWWIFVRRPFSFCVKSSAGILEQSMGARNRVGIGFSYRPARLQSLAELIPGHLT